MLSIIGTIASCRTTSQVLIVSQLVRPGLYQDSHKNLYFLRIRGLIYGPAVSPSAEPSNTGALPAMADATPNTSSPPTNALAELTSSRDDGKAHLLLAASGSVATIKIPNIITALTKAHPPSTLSIRLILTSSASNFLAGQSAEQPDLRSLLAIPGLDGIYHDGDEWGRGPSVGPEEGVWRRGGPILHIELRRWADLMAVVPLSANTLAKVVGGICDNLLTSVVRAWDADGRVDGRRKRILVAPAMNVSAPGMRAPQTMHMSKDLPHKHEMVILRL